MIKIFPSLISADLLNLKKAIDLLEDYCAGFHIDVMDFHFVPNLTMGPDFVNQIRKATKKQLQIHLMVEYPETYLDRMNLQKKDIVCIHAESLSEFSTSELFDVIRKKDLIPSLAISPFTPIEAVIQLRNRLEHVLMMTVNPGFSGQKFMPHVIAKINALREFKIAHELNFTIAADGGINSENISELIAVGVQEFAIASAIFDQMNPVAELQKLSTFYENSHQAKNTKS